MSRLIIIETLKEAVSLLGECQDIFQHLQSANWDENSNIQSSTFEDASSKIDEFFEKRAEELQREINSLKVDSEVKVLTGENCITDISALNFPKAIELLEKVVGIISLPDDVTDGECMDMVIGLGIEDFLGQLKQ